MPTPTPTPASTPTPTPPCRGVRVGAGRWACRPALLVLVGLVALALATPRTQAREERRILFSSEFGFLSFPIGGALSELGLLRQTTSITQREDLLLAALRDGPWDLVIIRWYPAFQGDMGQAIIELLQQHVEGGGRLMFSMAHIDRQPQLWPILGIQEAQNLARPLQDIVTAYGLENPTGRHPAFGMLGWAVNDNPFLPPSPDYGDHHVPAHGAMVIARFEDDGTGAIIVSNDGRVIVNGQHWDYWESGILNAERQLRWLLFCPADLDGDGELTVFDFLEFQNRFTTGSGFADFDYNGSLDLFDFLGYFNLYSQGC